MEEKIITLIDVITSFDRLLPEHIITTSLIIKPKTRRKKKKTNDKILHNKYNRGDVEYTDFSEPKIDVSFRMGRLNDSYDSYDSYRMLELNNYIYTIYKNTTWERVYDTTKRIPKQDLSEVYSFLKERITDTTYTNSEIFVTIAQFLDVNMGILYSMIGPAYKEELIEELKVYRPKLIKNKIAPLF